MTEFRINKLIPSNIYTYKNINPTIHFLPPSFSDVLWNRDGFSAKGEASDLEIGEFVAPLHR